MTAATASTFEALVGTTFRVVGEWSPDGEPEPEAAGPTGAASDDATPSDVELTLTEVVRLDHAGPFEQFRLVLVGRRDAPLEQASYVLDPAPGGIDALFIVPNDERDVERVYSANLSVPRPPAESVEP